MIDIRLLQAAVNVAEERNVTRAADRSGLTQPALSKQLAELEDRVGYVLFERRQKFAITPGGAAFVEHARIALAEINKAVQSGRAATLGADQILEIVKSPYVDPYFTSIMRSIRLPLYPGLRLRFSSRFSPEALQMLRSREIDMTVTVGTAEPGGLTSIRLGEEPFFVALPSSDVLHQRTELHLKDLHGRAWAMFERHVNPAIYDRLQQLLSEDGIQPTEMQHVQQAEEAAALVLQRGCVAFLTKTGAWRIMGEQIAIRPLQDDRLLLRTFLSARLEEDSRLIADFTRTVTRRLAMKVQQAKLPLAS